LLNVQTELVELELKGLTEEYNELADTWKQIDSKAQITASVAGVFLGAVFAIQRVPKFAVPGGENHLLAVALGFLVICIICAMKGLQLRDISFPPRGASLGDTFDLLYRTREFEIGGNGLVERILRQKQQQVSSWRKVNSDTLRIVTSKGRWTLGAQWLFALGATLFAAISIYDMYRKVPDLLGAV
jgi:hypothetical protein